MKRYWLEFALDPTHVTDREAFLLKGCGVTAHSRDDCLHLVMRVVLRGDRLPEVRDVIENVDVSTLDKNHVLPNMGLVTERGVWFPNFGSD